MNGVLHKLFHMKSRLDRSVFRAIILARAYSRADDSTDVSARHLFRGAIAAHYRSLFSLSPPTIRHLRGRKDIWTPDSKRSLARAGRHAARRGGSAITIRDLLLALRETDTTAVDADLASLGVDPKHFFSRILSQ